MTSSEILIASSVACKPAEDLAAALRAVGRPASVVSAMDASAWRERFSSGVFARSFSRGAALLYPWWVVARLVRSKPATVVATTNPFFLPPLLVLLRRVHRWQAVPLIYDLYPDALIAAGVTHPSSLVSRIGAALNRYTFRHAPAVVFIGQCMAEGAREKYGAPVLSEVIATGAKVREFERVRDETNSETTGVLSSYVGNLGAMHDFETLAGAIPRILRSPGGAAVRILVAASGSGADRLRQSCRGIADERLQFRAPLGDAEWTETLVESKISIITLARAAARISVPSKAFSALAAGSAILAVAPAGSDLHRLVMDHDVGVVTEPGDVEGLTAAWLELLRDADRLARYRANSLRVARRFDVELLARDWAALLDKLAASNTVRLGNP